MSEADRMFEELGYKKQEKRFKNDIETIEYRQTMKDEI